MLEISFPLLLYDIRLAWCHVELNVKYVFSDFESAFVILPKCVKCTIFHFDQDVGRRSSSDRTLLAIGDAVYGIGLSRMDCGLLGDGFFPVGCYPISYLESDPFEYC